MNTLAHTGRQLFGTFTDLLYPRACAVCDVPLAEAERSAFCSACTNGVARLKPPFCQRCSMPFAGADDGIAIHACATCRDRDFAFDCAVSAIRHTGEARDLIARFKYRGEHHLRAALAEWLAESLRDERIAGRRFDALVPVPLHPRRWRERGFNQAEECCRVLGKQTGAPVWKVLRRNHYTETQTHLSRTERAKNLIRAFAVARRFGRAKWADRILGKDLLLVDDVFTSGATVHACARVLRGAGAASVRVITVARR